MRKWEDLSYRVRDWIEVACIIAVPVAIMAGAYALIYFLGGSDAPDGADEDAGVWLMIGAAVGMAMGAR